MSFKQRVKGSGYFSHRQQQVQRSWGRIKAAMLYSSESKQINAAEGSEWRRIIKEARDVRQRQIVKDLQAKEEIVTPTPSEMRVLGHRNGMV